MAPAVLSPPAGNAADASHGTQAALELLTDDRPFSHAPNAYEDGAAPRTAAAPVATGPLVDGACDLDEGLPHWRGEVTPMHVGVARERVFQAARKLQEARADQFEAVRPLETRRAELEIERLGVAADSQHDVVARHRLEDAYNDYVAATRLFDEEYRTILDMLEQVTRRRAVRKWWKRALRRLAGEKPEDMEAATTVAPFKRDEPPASH
jgi:hypothetical protein